MCSKMMIPDNELPHARSVVRHLRTSNAHFRFVFMICERIILRSSRNFPREREREK